MQPGQQPQWRPLNRQDSHVAQQMVARAAELARDSHARTRHAAVLVKDDSLLAWGNNGVPFPGEDHCYCKFGESGHHDQCRTHAAWQSGPSPCRRAWPGTPRLTMTGSPSSGGNSYPAFSYPKTPRQSRKPYLAQPETAVLTGSDPAESGYDRVCGLRSAWASCVCSAVRAGRVPALARGAVMSRSRAANCADCDHGLSRYRAEPACGRTISVAGSRVAGRFAAGARALLRCRDCLAAVQGPAGRS